MSEHFYTASELAEKDPLKRSAGEFARYIGPPLTDEMVRQAEMTLGVKLPEALLDLLRESNGGSLKRRTFHAAELGEDIEMPRLGGLGWAHGLDSATGSLYMAEEWGYPEGLLWIDGDGHCGVFLDYRACGPQGEPSVAWYDTEEDSPIPFQLAPNFADFVSRLSE